MDNKRENEQFTLEEIMSGDYESDEVFSLESILAEFKSDAFIAGDKKTPSDELARKARQIVEEVTGKNPEPDDMPPVPEPEPEPEPVYEPAPEPEPIPEPELPVIPEPEPEPELDDTFHDIWESVYNKSHEEQKDGEPAKTNVISFDDLRSINEEPAHQQEAPAAEEEPAPAAPEDDLEEDFFEAFRLAKEEAKKPVPPPVTIEDDEGDKAAAGLSFFASLFSGKRGEEEEAPDLSDVELSEDEDDYEEEEEVYDIPSEIERFSAPVKSLTFRILGAGLLSVFMLIFTVMFEGGKSLPFGIGASQPVGCGVILILQLVVMLLGLDVLIKGAEDLLSAEPGAETLVLISCLFTVADGMVMLSRGSYALGLPFSVISAVSLLFAMRGKLSYCTAMRDTLKVYASSASPMGVISQQDEAMEREVLKKLPGHTEKFCSKLMGQDIAEGVFRKAAPVFILASFLFALLASVGRGRGEEFAHCFGIMTAVSASFPAVMSFSLPFACAIAKTKNMGAAVAGWEGACDIYDADSALITDSDVFPAGTVSLSGVKLFEGTDQRKAILYTSSLVIASQSGLSRVFSELLRSQGFVKRRVQDFACYEGGGIGGLVDGERVMVGSGAFMNLMGIRVPDSLNVKNSLFTAINDELSAVFTINYVPADSVQNALNAIINTRVNVMLAVRDFNVTPNAIQQKFRVSMEGVELIPIEKSYELSEEDDERTTGAAAVLSREGLAPMAEAVTRGRLLKTAAELNTLISLAGSVLGVVIMFFLCWTESYASATAGNVFVFMTAVALCVILLSQTVKKRL